MKQALHDPWLRYRDTGLYVVPSIHYRQVFAQLVYSACRRKAFDVIAVELPRSFQTMGVIDAFLNMAPAPGLVINPTGKKKLMRVPINDHPDCEEKHFRLVKLGLLYPMTPCDSIVMALRCPQLLQKHWPGWQPEVVLIDAEQRDAERPAPPLPLADDYEVMELGLAAFYDRLEGAFQSGRNVSIDTKRERIMASQLRGLLDQDKEILLVCGAAHWKNLRERLDSEVREQFAEERNSQPARLILAPVRPEVVWLWGWLDDIPRVAWELERRCEMGEPVDDFDKRDAVREVWREGVTEGIAAKLPVSSRRLLKMERYVDALAGAAGKWVPELDAHLVHAASACVESRFAKVFKKVAMEFPTPLPDGLSYAEFMSDGEDGFFMVVGDETFHVKPAPGSEATGRRLPLPVAPRLSGLERKQRDQWASEVDENGKRKRPLYRDFPDEQGLHNRLIKRARQLAHRITRESTVRKFTGGLGEGPSWRRTIRAKAAGEPNALYVRYSKRPRRSDGDCDGRCPVVWVFDVHSPILKPFEGFVPSEARSNRPACYSTFYWLLGSEFLGDTPIEQFHVAYSVSLMRGLMSPTERTEEQLTALVKSFPENRLCKKVPWDDPELSHLRGYELAVGCGIKYAGDHMIVVALPSEPLGPAVMEYAARKGVRVIRVSRDDFEQSALERMALDHNVPTISQFKPPYDWVARFVPPV
jgi:hypothetical protein